MTAMTMAVSSPSKKGGLRGPRPQALKVSSSSTPPSSSSRPSTRKSNSANGGAAPVIVYEHTPKVVHARPHEFMTVVQRLTGMRPASSPAPLPSYDVHVAPGEEGAGGGDPLLLTLGHHRAPPPMAAGQLLSPGGFFFSPNTMQSIQELSSMF